MSVTNGAEDRLAALRDAIAAGRYAPDPDAVAESLLAWTAPTEVFDRPIKPPAPPADAPRRREGPPEDRSRR